MQLTIPVLITVEPKEDVTAEGTEPSYPTTQELSSRISDVLGDVTKHDGMIGWRVMRVEWEG